MAPGGSDRRRRKRKGSQLQSPTAGHPPPHDMGPPPTFPPQSTSLPPTFFMPPPGPVDISVSSVGPNSGSNLNFIPSPNVASSPGFNIGQQGSSSALPTSSTPAASPASSTHSVSRLNIGVSGTSTTPSIGSATPAASRGRRGKVTLQYDPYSRLIIVPDEKDGFFPSFAAANMVTKSMKPFYHDAWGRWKDIPYDIRDKMWNQFRILCVWEPRYDNEIKYTYEKKAKKLIPSSLYEAREKNKKPGWIREDVWIKFLAYWDSAEFKEKSERAKAARASQKGGSLHTGGSMSFAAHRQRLEMLKGGPVSDAEVFAETHKKKKKDGSREGWVETRASEQYDGFHRSLDEWCQTQPTSDDGTPIQPSPDVMTSIWTNVAGGISKGRVYGLGVQRPSSFRPSPLVSDAPIVQNQEEVDKKMELLSKRCERAEAHIARMDKYMKKHMPHYYDDDDDETDSDM